ncbi:polyamine ABC transporter ATP-binding protein, partial [Burkholderia sp. Bp8998]
MDRIASASPADSGHRSRPAHDAFVRIENVVKKFGDSTAVDNVNLT